MIVVSALPYNSKSVSSEYTTAICVVNKLNGTVFDQNRENY